MSTKNYAFLVTEESVRRTGHVIGLFTTRKAAKKSIKDFSDSFISGKEEPEWFKITKLLLREH